MAWQGGFSGVSFDRAEFRKWLRSQKKPPYQRIVIHNTAAPYVIPPVKGSTRMINLGHYYKSMGWSGGPDFFVIFDRVYLGSPLGKSIGCKGWNGNSFHVECEGDYDGTHDPKKEPGLTAWKTMAWVADEILEWMGWKPGADVVKFHKEGITSHDCPGKLVTKDWFLGLVREGETQEPVTPASNPTQKVEMWVNTPGDTLNFRADPGGRVKSTLPHGLKVLVVGESEFWALVNTPAGYQGWVSKAYLSKTSPAQTAPIPKSEPVKEWSTETTYEPGNFKYSQFCVDWAKRFEGFRANAYWDVSGWAIGYGHNGGSGVPPMVYANSTITPEEAEKVLMADLDLQLHYVNFYVSVPLTQGQVDALILHVFQQGPGNFREGRVRPLINAGKHKEAAEMIKNWPTSKAGLVRRRAVEAQMYLGEKPTKW